MHLNLLEKKVKFKFIILLHNTNYTMDEYNLLLNR